MGAVAYVAEIAEKFSEADEKPNTREVLLAQEHLREAPARRWASWGNGLYVSGPYSRRKADGVFDVYYHDTLLECDQAIRSERTADIVVHAHSLAVPRAVPTPLR